MTNEEQILKLCSKGRISIEKASELLQKSVYDLQEIAIEKGIEVGVTAEEYEKSKQVVEELV